MATPVLSNFVGGADTTTPFTLGYTPASGIEYLMLIVVFNFGSAAAVPAGATFGGVAADEVYSGTVLPVDASANTNTVVVYKFPSPAAGANTWSFTTTGGTPTRCQMFCVSIVGCDPTVIYDDPSVTVWNPSTSGAVSPDITAQVIYAESQVLSLATGLWTQLPAQTVGTSRYASTLSPTVGFKTLGERSADFVYYWDQTYGGITTERMWAFDFEIIAPLPTPPSTGGDGSRNKYYLRRRLT